MPLVSLCMIMKNEEDELPLVLASAVGMADEIVIYDTGSTDRSVALARELGATVIEGYWDDDFSRARNEALALCTCEWILWLDADEAVHGDASSFRSQLFDEQAFDAYLVPIESIEGAGLGVRSAFHAARVFRRERCHWYGAIHEQIGLQDGDAYPATTVCSQLRILHRGYTRLKWNTKDLIERNLRIARNALEDPNTDRSRALFDFGRTLTEGEDPTAGLAPLREAADTTTLATVRRAALRNIFHVYLAKSEFDQAERVLAELRSELTKTISADVMLVKLLLLRKDYSSCLETIERIPYADTDEDGFELGRATVAWAKAHALDALGRYGEAADALLDALRTHGQLDESLGALVGLLQRADRSPDEIAQQARTESMPVLVAMASRLPTPEADEVLASFAVRYPDRLEPLAAARDVAARLAVPRAMWWSDRLRTAGLGAMCPLVVIARNEELEPLFRLLAAAGGYLSFSDERLVRPARDALACLSGRDRPGAIELVRGISSELATRMTVATEAVHLSRRGTVIDGYINYSTRSRSASPVVATTALPLADATVHDLTTEDVLAGVSHDRSGAVLAEWARVVCNGGKLRLCVPNLEAVHGLLAAGQSAELRRLLFGGRRFGCDGTGEANADAWSYEELTTSLRGVGFEVEKADIADSIAIDARRAGVVSRRAVGEVPPACVVVISSAGAKRLLGQLRSLSETDAGIDFETVVLVNGPDDEVLTLLASLQGKVTVARSPVTLDLAAATNEAVRLARAAAVVVLSPRARPTSGWLARLVSLLSDPTIGVVGAAVADERGLVVHAGFELVGDAMAPVLETTPRVAFLSAETALESDEDVDAVGSETIAVRRDLWMELRGLAPGWSELDAVIDLCLRARSTGRRCVVPAGCVVTAEPLEQDSLSRERLAWHWSGRTDLRVQRAASVSASSLMPSSTLIERITTVMAVPERPRRGGVNLVGDLSDGRVRAYEALLLDAGVPLSRLNWAGGTPTSIGDDRPFAYSTTLLALDGDQLVDYVSEVGTDSLRGRRTIVAWEWPLAHATAAAASAAAMVGEVWVPSRFAERALRPVAPRSMFVVPPPVVVPHDPSRSNAHLPDGFVFVVVARLGRGWPGDEALANPGAAIEAFSRAFAPGSGPVLCVVLHGRRTQVTADACRQAAQGRHDVLVIETDDPAVADAASVTTDCLVSLHRSNSFGSDIARALAAGRPVVATGYGGSMDYLIDSCAELVPYSLTTSNEAVYPHASGIEWAEPDIEAAAELLRSVHHRYDEALSKARYGRNVVTRLYGPRASARSLRKRLGELSRGANDTARRTHTGSALS